MVRTQLYLPKELFQEIALKAQREGKPKAEVIRAALVDGLKGTKQPEQTLRESLLGLAELGKKLNMRSDDPNLSTNIDKYLYEEWDQK